MVDPVEMLKQEQAWQEKQETAKDAGNIINIWFDRSFGGRMMVIDANHPVLINVYDLPDDMGYQMAGGAVNSYSGECPVQMTSLEELAAEGITEIVLEGDDGTQLRLPIGQGGHDA